MRSLPCMRPFDGADLEALVRIENASFPSAWSRDVLVRFLRREEARCWVIGRDGQSAGFLLVLDEVDRWQVANLAIAPAHRRQGLGLFALRTLDELARGHGVACSYLHVRESNLPAQLLYRKAGYRASAILSDYYPDEPAYRMERAIVPRDA